MYIVDDLDSVVWLATIPTPKSEPIVFAEEDSVVLSYYTIDESPFEPTTAPLAIVRFGESYLHFFGPPLYYSDPPIEEVLEELERRPLASIQAVLLGHPLASRGLSKNSVFRVDRSSLLRHFEGMHSVHPYYDQPRFDRLTHYIFTFPFSTFECISESIVCAVENCGLDEEYSRMLDHLNRE